jgi:hypothetical protein
MSEIGETWAGIKKVQKEAKTSRYEANMRILANSGIPYVAYNNGLHIIVDSYVDFWPSTGRWRLRGSSIRYYGVVKLIDNYKKHMIAKTSKIDVSGTVSQQEDELMIVILGFSRTLVALKKIASYDEGDNVDSSFDEPHSARVARECLNIIDPAWLKLLSLVEK